MKLCMLFVSFVLFAGAQPPSSDHLAPIRPPAVPLIAHDPYFSIWSAADRLTDSITTHWTGKPNSLTALARIDSKTYALTGGSKFPAMDQAGLEVLPTRTIYQFLDGGVRLELTFFTPALPDDLDVLSRPLSYVEWDVRSADGKQHNVALYFDASSELVVNTRDQPVSATRVLVDGQTALRIGSREQPILAKRGDDLRIDWGYLYLEADRPDGVTASIGLRKQENS
jgi:hypothetical protein